MHLNNCGEDQDSKMDVRKGVAQQWGLLLSLSKAGRWRD